MADSTGTGDIISGLGGALGGLFGGLSSLASTQAGVSSVQDMTNTGASQIAPYNFTGANYLGPIGADLLGDNTTSANIGQGRTAAAGNTAGITLPNYSTPTDFEDFAKNYNTSEGAQYLMRTAAAAQDSSAASKGGLLSGANLRAQTGIAEGIANQDLTSQYTQELAGQQQGFSQQLQSSNQELAAQQQDFSQRETSYQNMYGQEAMGLQAGIAEAGTYAQGARAIGSLYQGLSSQAATAGNSFGSALGTVFTGLGKAFGFG